MGIQQPAGDVGEREFVGGVVPKLVQEQRPQPSQSDSHSSWVISSRVLVFQNGLSGGIAAATYRWRGRLARAGVRTARGRTGGAGGGHATLPSTVHRSVGQPEWLKVELLVLRVSRRRWIRAFPHQANGPINRRWSHSIPVGKLVLKSF